MGRNTYQSDFAHGLMFHHFCGGRHPRGQGAITADEFAKCLDYAGADRLLPAEEWMTRAKSGALERSDVCVTFDDGLACQIDVAVPVLERRGLTAFWFVYTAPLRGEPGRLEVYRRFRTEHFATVEEFYGAFDRALERAGFAARAAEGLRDFDPAVILRAHPYYSEADVRFRQVRDGVLSAREYDLVMERMISDRGLELAALAEGLWMGPDDVRSLAKSGHQIGLHSHTHPTVMAALSEDEQRAEYVTNQSILTEVAGRIPESVGHPCNSYNDATLRILGELGIAVGFRADMNPGGGLLEIPRQDHANLMRALALT